MTTQGKSLAVLAEERRRAHEQLLEVVRELADLTTIVQRAKSRWQQADQAYQRVAHQEGKATHAA